MARPSGTATIRAPEGRARPSAPLRAVGPEGVSPERPIRVLHVLNALNPGGVQTGLLQTISLMDRSRFRVDVLTGTPRSHPRLLADFEEIGVRVIHGGYRERPLSFFGTFDRVVREFGPYDVVHSHMRHYSGVVMRWAARHGVPERITQIHNDLSVWLDEASWPQRAGFAIARRWIRRHATTWLGVSRRAGQSLFGLHCEEDPRWVCLSSGISLEPFRPCVDRAQVREELGIPEGALVVGHVGRFHRQKNHEFLIELFHEVRKRDPSARLVLVGAGETEPRVRQRVAELGLSDAVLFAGVRFDVPRLMQGAFDVFVLPSRFEGMPRTVIEAQACALPCVISDGIASEVDLLPSLVTRVRLGDPLDTWATAVLTRGRRPRPVDRLTALAEIDGLPIAADRVARGLEQIYARGLAPAGR